MTRYRTLLALVLSIVVAAAPAAPALAQDNAAVAVNTKDGSSVFKLAFDISKTMQPVVESTNAAVAYASCSDCRTVAIAIQVVLVMGDVTTFTPENVAIALNQACSSCETFAAAYQIVLGIGTPVRITGQGRHQIEEIRKALRDLADANLPFDQLAAKLKELTNQLKQVLATELVPVHWKPRQQDGNQSGGDGQGDANPTATPDAQSTPGGDATPTGTATPAPAETATPTASPDPASTATPEPSATAAPAATP